MRLIHGFALAALAALPACSDDPTAPPAERHATALEAVPFEQVRPGKLVFFRKGTLTGPFRHPAAYVIDGNAGRAWGAVLTEWTTQASSISASPDGRRLLVDNWDLFSGGSLTVAALDETGIQHPSPIASETLGIQSWMPDSERIVFGKRLTPLSEYALFSQRVGNAARTQIFPTSAANGMECERSTSNIHGPISVAASGALLLTCVDSAIYVIDPGAARARPLYVVHGGLGSGWVKAPVWSPDGGRIAFFEITLHDTELELAVRVMNADASGLVTIAAMRARSMVVDPTLCWMPDGERIAFTMPNEDTALIYIVRLGGAPVQVTSAVGVRDESLSCTA